MSQISNRTKLEIVVDLKELEEKKALSNLAAYLFNSQGQLIEKRTLKPDVSKQTTGRVEIPIDAKEGNLSVKIGPDMADIQMLKRYNPIVSKVEISPGKKNVLSFDIDKPGWICWIKVPYLVTGTVDKFESGHNVPICFGEVDIYDVDVGYCLMKLPDHIIERIRDSIIDLVLDPPPIIPPKFDVFDKPHLPHWDDDDYCGTPPGPRPPINVDILKKLEALPPEWNFATQRFKTFETSRARVTNIMEKMQSVEKSAWLNNEAVEDVKISKILYSNTLQFRTLLIDKFQAFRFWLCWYPWIYWIWWPFCRWYSLEKLGTAKLQPDGSFSKTIYLSICRNDIPDLWFVVRQKINGSERVIYARYPVPCNTYWNQPSGKAVNLVVTDPLAIGCPEGPEIDLDPANLWVVPLAIGNYSFKKIYGTGAGSLPADNAKIGLYEDIYTGLGGTLSTFNNGPFGGMLGLRFLFSPALETAGVKYYRIKYRANGAGTWTALDHEVVRHYSHYDSATDTLEFKPYSLGPQTRGLENSLFEIPPDKTPNYATEPDARWFVIDATVDLINGYLDSTKLTEGYVEFKFELFDDSGARIHTDTFGAGGIAFKLPSNVDIWSTISTANASTVNSDLVMSDPEDPSFQIFIFRLQIDNRQPTAIIGAPTVSPSGHMTNDCGIISYNPAPSKAGDPPEDTSATMPYQARHPRKFGIYQFSLYRSTSLLHVENGQVGDMGVSGSFAYNANLKPDLLGICPAAAFSENLYIWNMAFNGWSRVGPDASAVRAFALVLKT